MATIMGTAAWIGVWCALGAAAGVVGAYLVLCGYILRGWERREL